MGSEISAAATPRLRRGGPFVGGHRTARRPLLTHRFQIHLITDRKSAGAGLIGAVAAALGSGVDWVQVREKTGPARELYETTREIMSLARQSGAGVMVNDRIDVALATGADGVHLAGKSLPPRVARELVGDLLLGASVHGPEEAREAVDGGVDYVTFGHVYPTSSKPGLSPRGVLQLAEVVESVDVPVLAIGGIDTSNVEEVLQTGCAGIAVISAVLAAEKPGYAARELRLAVDSSQSCPRHPFPELIERGAR